MTTMTAPAHMLVAYEDKLGQGASKFVQAVTAYPKRMKKRERVKGRSMVPQVERVSNAPTPERVAQAGEALETTDMPPYVVRVTGVTERYQRQLGQDAVLILSRFQELADVANRSRGLTAGYDGNKVDSSSGDFQNMSERQRASLADFHEAWNAMGDDFRRLAAELLLEVPTQFSKDGEKARGAVTIGHELCNYAGKQQAHAAVVAALRILSWRLSELMGGRIPVRRPRRAQAEGVALQVS